MRFTFVSLFCLGFQTFASAQGIITSPLPPDFTIGFNGVVPNPFFNPAPSGHGNFAKGAFSVTFMVGTNSPIQGTIVQSNFDGSFAPILTNQLQASLGPTIGPPFGWQTNYFYSEDFEITDTQFEALWDGRWYFNLDFTNGATLYQIARTAQTNFLLFSKGNAPEGLPGISAISTPAINSSGAIAFRAGFTGTSPRTNYQSILVSNARLNSPTSYMVGYQQRATVGDYAPNEDGNTNGSIFATLGDPLLNENGRIVFQAAMKRGVAGITANNASGIWSDRDGTVKRLLQQTDQEPDGGLGKFTKFDQIGLTDSGRVIVFATVTEAGGRRNQGVWSVSPDGSVHRIVKTGETLNSKVIKTVKVFQLTPGLYGQSRNLDSKVGRLAFEVLYADGTWGIYKTTVP